MKALAETEVYMFTMCVQTNGVQASSLTQCMSILKVDTVD